MPSKEDSFDCLEPVLAEMVVSAFEGEMDEDNNYHGKGEIKMNNGCTYEGQLKHGLFHGTGKFKWKDEVLFEGDFYQGVISGTGKFSWPDGSQYTGQVKYGKRHGEGVFKCSGGQLYDGDWKNGKRHGKGTSSYDEGKSTIVYSGDWVENLRHGYGTMKYASGNMFEGFWVDDKKCGKGVMVWKDKENVYAGDWKDDLPHGEGETLWANVTMSKLMTKQLSSIYRGQWAEGTKHGDGAFFYSDGSQYSGKWVKDSKEGPGVILHGDGKIAAADFKKGQNLLEKQPPAHTPALTKKGKSNNSSPPISKSKVAVNAAAPVRNYSPAATKANQESSALDEKDATLHLRDLLQALPRGLDTNNQDSLENPSPARVFLPEGSNADAEGREVERLLLRYNTSLKHVYARLQEGVHKESRMASLQQTLNDPQIDFSAVDKAMSIALVQYQKLFCTTLAEVKAYALEVGIIGEHYTAYDLSQCLLGLQSEQKKLAHAMFVKQFKSEGASNSEGTASTDALRALEVATPTVNDLHSGTIGPTAVQRDGLDSDQPVTERDFIALLVRSCVESELRNSTKQRVFNPATDELPMPQAPVGFALGELQTPAAAVDMPLTLFQTLNKNLGRIHATQDVSKTDRLPMIRALTNTRVQSALRDNTKKSVLKSVWQRAVALARSDGIVEAESSGVAQMRHAIKVLMQLRGPTGTIGSVLSEGATLKDLLAITTQPLASIDGMVQPVVLETTTYGAAAEGDATTETAAEEGKEADKGVSAEGGEAPPGTAPGTANGTRPGTVVPVPVVSAASVKAMPDYSCLTKLIDYDDFVEKACRVLVSPLWVYEDPVVITAREEAKVAALAAAAEVEAETGADGEVKGGEPVEEKKDNNNATETGETVTVETGADIEPTEQPVEVVLADRLELWLGTFDPVVA